MQTMEQKKLTVSEMVREDYRLADVFKKWGISYCCGGNLSLSSLCEVKAIDQSLVEKELAEAKRTIAIPSSIQFSEWNIPFLLQYLSNLHHAYIRRITDTLVPQFNAYVAGHKNKYPYLEAVADLFQELTDELLKGVREEEEKLFPYLLQLHNTYQRKEVYGSLFVRTLGGSMTLSFSNNQKRISALLEQLRKLTGNYTFSSDVCTNHRVYYVKLKEFDDDLVQHMFLENNILLPKAAEIEKALAGA